MTFATNQRVITGATCQCIIAGEAIQPIADSSTIAIGIIIQPGIDGVIIAEIGQRLRVIGENLIPAGKRIMVRPTIERVISSFTDKGIIADITSQQVRSRTAKGEVIVGTAINPIIAILAINNIVSFTAFQTVVPDGAPDPVVTIAADDGIIATITNQHIRIITT